LTLPRPARDGYLTFTKEAVEITLLRSKSRVEPVAVKIPRADNPGLVAALDRHRWDHRGRANSVSSGAVISTTTEIGSRATA
jgi:hypothetical protein